jgi:DNA repair protein SbcC/Rad50
MILKQMKLQNIRSYKEQIIDFPLGRTLFEGDIGSGKSTILMALEFGLFGLGSEKAGSLLRAGETDGSVGVLFESAGGQYVVTRHLIKKGRSINQDNCVLKTPDGAAKSYSATEIKEKILDVLDFNEPPDPKAQSWIYRYAIYTPQEEMKLILTLRPDQRLQTLRKAFHLEDYKTAQENANYLAIQVMHRSKEFSGMALEIDELKAKITELEYSTKQKEEELSSSRLQQTEKGDKLEMQKGVCDKLRTRQLSLKAETGRAEYLVGLIEEKKKEVWMAKNQVESFRNKIASIEPTIREYSKVPNPTEKNQTELRNDIESSERDLRELRNRETLIESKFKDYKSILEKGVCPLCDQLIDARNYGERVAHKEKELASVLSELQECEESLQRFKSLLDSKSKYDLASSKLEDLSRSLMDYKDNLQTWQLKFEQATQAQSNADQELASVRESMKALELVESQLRETERSISNLEDELKLISHQISSGESDLRNWSIQIGDYQKSIEKKQQKKARADKLNEYHVWISDYFIPTLETVEKQVMMNINQEFDAQFQKWFGMLVDDPGKQARIDEEFTPIIQQDGLDQDVSYLSGGEKTSVALAYRLALNTIVRKVSTGMQSNLLVLDEPTDGFSKEQLSKVREILDEIQSPQIVLVSHEKELESFADQIFKVSKTNGESSVSLVH